MATPGTRLGLFASLQNLSITLMAMLQSRMELLGNEFEVEKLRMLRMLMLVQAMAFTALVAALLFVALLTLWMWELRLGILGLFGALFLACAVLAHRALMQMVQREESPFAASVDALREDLQQLRQAAGHAAPPE